MADEPVKVVRSDDRLDEKARSKVSVETTLSVDGKNEELKTDNRHVDVQLDLGDVKIRSRDRWWKIWIPRGLPPPPRSSLDDAPQIPLSSASLLSILTYAWVSPLMTLGYQRTLQATDLWKVDDIHSAAFLANKFDQSWTRRQQEAEAWNEELDKGSVKPSVFKRMLWSLKSVPGSDGKSYGDRRDAFEENWRKVDGRREASLFLALHDTIGLFWWSAGLCKVLGDVSQLMGPLLVKAIINFTKARATAKAKGEEPQNLGVGFVMAFGLFLITILASIGQHQFFWRAMITGTLVRAALIKSIYTRGVNLTGKARTTISNSSIMNHISTDVSRIENCAQWFHGAWTAPIQILICLIILLVQLGPSALAGFALFAVIAPIQERAMSQQQKIRKESSKYTDQRAKTLLEVLGSMRVVKYFSYETPFLERIYKIRANELKGVKKILVIQSANIALAFSIPVLASTLAFVTYTHLHNFDVAVIFASLSLFQLLRQPMMFLPRALAATSDARSAISRLQKVFHADIRSDQALAIDKNLKCAVEVDHATFEWEEVLKNDDDASKKSPQEISAAPFRVRDITMHIQRGTLVAIVGRVGSGKSSLLMGLINEMRRVSGTVKFGGRVAYCPQTAWIQNASVRDNILFGQPFDEERYWQVVETSSLLPDLEVLGDGDLTEIGEKGVNLSGGQKQRINLARALYYNADVVIMDDPLSAVDAHVGKALFHNAVLGSLRNQGKTVIFVTHALHFLSYCDYIYTLRDGQIAEQGTFRELVDANGEFARLDKEFGGGDNEEEIESPSQDILKTDVQEKSAQIIKRVAGTGKLEGKLMVKEARATGSVSGLVYRTYFKAGRGWFTIPFLVLSLCVAQGAQVMSSYTLVWWQENYFHKAFSFYQMLYAVLAVGQSTFTFLQGVATDIFSYYVSRNLHHNGVFNIFHAPMSFYDTTPMGRVIGVFGKDIDNIDNMLPVSLRFLVITLASALGSVIIITVVEYYFIIVVVVISLGYQYFASFYRASAREVKRLDSMLRSLLYSHLSESLTGLPTIRTYGEIPRFLNENEYYIDLENRAMFVSITNQRWLAVRLDFCGALMVFFVALFAVFSVSGASAAQVGLVLTYTTSLTQACGVLTRQTAEFENFMNSVERLVQYSRPDILKQEAPHEIPESKPPPDWPQKGVIGFKGVSMRYRPGLPNVLHQISMSIQGGEKIGIVGRTGAGKSSITLALLRIVEFEGLISIDDVDISKIGLKDLRTKIAIIPQDPTIFSGTVRTALDPFSLYDDARLWDALRRSFLVEDTSMKVAEDSTRNEGPTSSQITLDTVIESDGSNLSVGQRSLLSLARALVRDTRVVILDEATASVDLETDKKIQYTIQTEFKDRTLICIAHRLRTILNYDRILVLHKGNIEEFDTPLSLYQRGDGIFRGLCEESNITEKDFLGY